jgi:Tat protein secretion system quality control protein TatD with DNase activity
MVELLIETDAPWCEISSNVRQLPTCQQQQQERRRNEEKFTRLHSGAEAEPCHFRYRILDVVLSPKRRTQDVVEQI